MSITWDTLSPYLYITMFTYHYPLISYLYIYYCGYYMCMASFRIIQHFYLNIIMYNTMVCSHTHYNTYPYGVLTNTHNNIFYSTCHQTYKPPYIHITRLTYQRYLHIFRLTSGDVPPLYCISAGHQGTSHQQDQMNDGHFQKLLKTFVSETVL